MEEYFVYIFSSLFATLGFITRFLWDFYINRRKRELTEKIKSLEFRLQEFYYPIFFYLKREQIIWDKIIKLHQNAAQQEQEQEQIQLQEQIQINIELASSNVQTQLCPSIAPASVSTALPHSINRHFDLVKALDEEYLKIHNAVQQIIHTKICIALPPLHLVEVLMQYDEHVTVYQILRKMGIHDKFPVEYDTPYPLTIIEEVEKRIHELDKEYIKYNNKLN